MVLQHLGQAKPNRSKARWSCVIRTERKAHFPWAVVTNGKKFQVVKARTRSGYSDIVPFAIVSRLFGADKPDPRIYHEAIRRLKLSFEGIDDIQPSEILFVGDNPYTDITGAVGVGMRTAWVRITDEFPDDAPSPDIEIRECGGVARVVGERVRHAPAKLCRRLYKPMRSIISIELR